MSFKDTHLTTNITHKETACRCECGMGFFPGQVDDDTIQNIYLLAQNIQILVNHLQVFIDFPNYIKIYVKINSWCRCPVHNENEGGSSNSIHKTGGAADIKLSWVYRGQRIYLRPQLICRAALMLNEPKITTFNGIGCYVNRVHLDVRPSDMVTWYYKSYNVGLNNSRDQYGVDFTEEVRLA